MNTNNNVVKDSLSAVGINLYTNDFLVGNAEFLCCFGVEVNVSFSCDNALCDFNLAAGTNYLTSARVLDVARLSYGSGNSDASCVCE